MRSLPKAMKSKVVLLVGNSWVGLLSLFPVLARLYDRLHGCTNFWLGFLVKWDLILNTIWQLGRAITEEPGRL